MKMQLAFAMLAAGTMWGQALDSRWDEFSIGPPAEHIQVANPRNGIRAEAVTLKKVLSRAFGVPENRIFGPDWLGDDRYALTALTKDWKDFQPMMQQELATRFHMLAHRENKVVPVFVLKPLDSPAKLAEGTPRAAISISGGGEGRGGIKYPHATMAAFATTLADVVGRPVLDETRMDGVFDIVLNWKMGSNSSLQDAVKNQLGLELADDRRAVDLVVIDHIEKVHFPQ